jgi:hypothetical protein
MDGRKEPVTMYDRVLTIPDCWVCGLPGELRGSEYSSIFICNKHAEGPVLWNGFELIENSDNQ